MPDIDSTTSSTTLLSDQDDLTLVKRSLDGDFNAFSAIVLRYQDRAHRLAWSMMRDESEAQDVVQEAFLNIYRKLDTFEGNAQFSSWLYRVVVNAALMRLRKRHRQHEISLEEVPPTFDLEASSMANQQWRLRSDQAVENLELRSKILAAIDDLPPKYQVVFILKEVEGLSLNEISEALEISLPAVKSRLHRARLFLQASLERYLR